MKKFLSLFLGVFIAMAMASELKAQDPHLEYMSDPVLNGDAYDVTIKISGIGKSQEFTVDGTLMIGVDVYCVTKNKKSKTAAGGCDQLTVDAPTQTITSKKPGTITVKLSFPIPLCDVGCPGSQVKIVEPKYFGVPVIYFNEKELGW
jgi:hypothetical protein